jgi:FtsH-binding integral membrane protein
MYAAVANDVPVLAAGLDERVAFLRKVAVLTVSGLCVAGVSGIVSAGGFMMLGAVSPMFSMIVVFGAFFAAQYGAQAMVDRTTGGTQLAAFYGGTVLQGIAMGYLLLAAMLQSIQVFGNPFVFIVQAMGLVSLTSLGMGAYLMTGPRELSMVKGGLAALSLPMFALMIVSAFFPIGGVFGLGLSALFVLVSAGGLLYQLNLVLHTMPTRMPVQSAFMITMSLLVLFWNVLVLLMRLNRR